MNGQKYLLRCVPAHWLRQWRGGNGLAHDKAAFELPNSKRQTYCRRVQRSVASLAELVDTRHASLALRRQQSVQTIG